MYRRILVPVDGSQASQRGLAEAITLTKGLGAQLCLVHVINEVMPTSVDMMHSAVDFITLAREAGETTLENALNEVRRQGLDAEGKSPEIFSRSAAGRAAAAATTTDRCSQWRNFGACGVSLKSAVL
jgi:nucleotide-binding universal stress UspA family protein